MSTSSINTSFKMNINSLNMKIRAITKIVNQGAKINPNIPKMIEVFPHIKACDITLQYVLFAEKNRNNYREQISKQLISRKELNELIEIDKMHYSNMEIELNPNLINHAITCALYERGFFKL